MPTWPRRRHLAPPQHPGDKMAVYVIADIEVLDPVLFEEYR
jgi:hypothetical protein